MSAIFLCSLFLVARRKSKGWDCQGDWLETGARLDQTEAKQMYEGKCAASLIRGTELGKGWSCSEEKKGSVACQER